MSGHVCECIDFDSVSGIFRLNSELICQCCILLFIFMISEFIIYIFHSGTSDYICFKVYIIYLMLLVGHFCGNGYEAVD